MSEIYPASGQGPETVAKPAWAVRTTDEMVNFFLEKDTFTHFERNALAIKTAIDEVIADLRQREEAEDLTDSDVTPLKIYLPLTENNGRKVYKKDMSPLHVDLFDAAYAVTNAELKRTEISEDSPNGRVWWSGAYRSGLKDYPMNFIEIHDQDEGGEYLKWQLVTDVPYDLINPVRSSDTLHPSEKKLMFRQAMSEIEDLLRGDFGHDELDKAA